MKNPTNKIIENDLSVKIAGSAGDGILNAGFMFAKTCMLGGLWVFATAEYPSLVRGGHNHLDVRVSHRQVYSHKKSTNLLVALNEESISRHLKKITPGGGLIYDSSEAGAEYPGTEKNIFAAGIPLLKIANECGGAILRNAVALGACTALLDFDIGIFSRVLENNFAKKKGSIARQNLAAAKAGYQYIKENIPGYREKFRFTLAEQFHKNNIFVSGNEALSIGAIKAGCKFFSGYPMTPASSIMHTMASFEKQYGVTVKHTEDEIAGINMAIGASFAGARAMTATSGGGFALMTEGLGLAAQTETPVVIALAQRPGPATGMATHSGQGDLRFVMHASTDEFPRVVITPGTAYECYALTIEAFNIAEKYQMPVVILTDKFLGESFAVTPAFQGDEVKVEQGEIVTNEINSEYRRYRITESGVSPRALPGLKGAEFVASSYEHDEQGFEREEEHIRMAMHEKRFRKFLFLEKEIPEPQIVGPDNGEATIFCWGSTKGPAIEAMHILQEKGVAVNMLHISFMSPLPAKKITEAMKNAKLTINIEGNKTAQFAGIVKEKTGLDFNCHILKYDGRPFNPDDLATAIEDLMKEDTMRVVILNGYQEALKARSMEDFLQHKSLSISNT